LTVKTVFGQVICIIYTMIGANGKCRTGKW